MATQRSRSSRSARISSELRRDTCDGRSDGDGVRVEHDQGKWTVIVTENGVVSAQFFDTEEETSAFAVAERMRLGQPEPKTTDLA